MDDKKLDRIEDKIDKITEHISSIDSTLASQHVSLKEHIRRTEILETEIKPIQKHVSMMQGAFKFIMYLSLIATIAEAIHFMVSK